MGHTQTVRFNVRLCKASFLGQTQRWELPVTQERPFAYGATTLARGWWWAGAWPGGAPEGIRTPNLLIRSQMLYPIELRMHFHVREIKG